MTSPIVGYPDWQQPVSRARLFAVLALASVLTEETVYGPLTTVNIDSVGVRAFANSGNGHLTLEWFNDQALTEFITGEVITMNSGDSFDFSVVVKGAFLKITATNVEPANWTLTLILYETPHGSIPQRTSRDNILVRVFGGVAVVGATDVDCLKIWPGEAYWYVFSSLATWTAEIRAVDDLGVIRTFARMGSTDAGHDHNLYLPAEHIRTRFNNTTAADGTYTLMLIAKPGLSGF